MATTQEDRILAQQNSELRHKIISNDFSVKGKAQLLHLELFECEHLEVKLNKRLAEHNNVVAEIRGVFTNMEENLIAAIDRAQEKDQLWEIVGAIDEARIDKPIVIGRIIKAWTDHQELREQIAQCLAPKIATAEAAANEVLKDVKAKLIEIGCGPDAMQAGPSHPAAAERQLEYFARYHNSLVVAAFAKLSHLRELHRSHVQGGYVATTRLAQAKIFANEQMLKLIN